MRLGAYDVVSQIGRGSMGVVFRARAPDGREVAVKLLVHASSGEAVARFERERRLLASLGEERGFVPLLDAGISQAGPYVVMPFVTGGTLRDRLRRGSLPLQDAIDLGLALARALACAHERGIVHRDLKPENVLFTADGRPLVSDLGIAKHFRVDVPGASQSTALSREGTTLGTWGYMPREQMANATRADARSDVFALGAILYEGLSGRPAFPGETAFEVLSRVESGSFAPLGRARPEAPHWLAGAVERALERDPERRFEHAGALLRALEARGHDRRPRRAALPVAVLGAVVLAAGGAALALGAPRGAPPPAPARAAASGEPAKPSPRPTRPAPSEPRPAETWLERGMAHLALGKNAEAATDFTRAIELDPRLAVAWTNRGAARVAQGDADGAIADLTRAVELDPRLAVAWMNRGTVLEDRGDLDAAIADYTLALEIDPRLTRAWQKRGTARGKKGDGADAIADLTRAVELDPSLALAWANRGLAREKNGDADGAIADSTRAVELQPSLAVAWATRGAARLAKNEHAGAIADLTRALELEPRDPISLVNRALARDATGDGPGAAADFERVLEVSPPRDPCAELARQRLAALRRAVPSGGPPGR